MISSSAPRSSASLTWPALRPDSFALRELEDHAARGSGQDRIRLRRRDDPAALHDMRTARAAFRQHAVTQEQGFRGACVRREPAQQYVAEQGGRLDVTAGPADILCGDCRDTLVDRVGGNYRQLLDAGKNRRPGRGLRHVIALRLDSAGHLHVEEQVAAAIAVHERAKCRKPAGAVERRLHADLGEAPVEARHVLVESVGARRHKPAAPRRRRRRTGSRDRAARSAPRRAAAGGHRARRAATASRQLLRQTRTGSCPRSCGRCFRAARPRPAAVALRRPPCRPRAHAARRRDRTS